MRDAGKSACVLMFCRVGASRCTRPPARPPTNATNTYKLLQRRWQLLNTLKQSSKEAPPPFFIILVVLPDCATHKMRNNTDGDGDGLSGWEPSVLFGAWWNGMKETKENTTYNQIKRDVPKKQQINLPNYSKITKKDKNKRPSGWSFFFGSEGKNLNTLTFCSPTRWVARTRIITICHNTALGQKKTSKNFK